MKNTNSFGVHFVLRRNKAVDGKCPVYVRIIVNKSRVEMTMKKYLAEKDWNTGNGKAKPNSKELKEFNTVLEEVRYNLTTHYQHLVVGGEPIYAETVKNAYLGIGQFSPEKPEETEPEKTLRWLAAEHNTVMAAVLKKGSLKNYFTTERYLHKYLESKYKSGDIDLKDLTYSFMTGFEFYIRKTPLKAFDPCTNNGTMKHLERVKKMTAWAAKNEWMEKNPFEHYSLKFKHTVMGFLEEEEVATIEKRCFMNPMQQKVKDLFVFSCYTGLCYADLISLTPDKIFTGSAGFQWIKSTRLKTDIGFNVPLLEPAVRIMEKYKVKEGEKPRETVFPYLSNQEMNNSLKIIAEVCQIPKVLTFHLARHTFATIALVNGVPFESVSKMMGHTKLSTTMLYTHLMNHKVGQDMRSFQHRLQEKNQAMAATA